MLSCAVSFSAFVRSPMKATSSKLFATVGEMIPSSINVDLITGDDHVEADIGEVLKMHKKAVLFAVPGAFTPTCSEKHLPGFIEKATELKRMGVDAIYCMSVNDKFVMKRWGKETEGATAAGIKFIADGNGEYARALGLEADKTGGRMGMRCTRFAAIIEYGKITTLNIDNTGFESSSVESIIDTLSVTA
jgi:glutaredoxin/glutathione-dependent peroxiredoxin